MRRSEFKGDATCSICGGKNGQHDESQHNILIPENLRDWEVIQRQNEEQKHPLPPIVKTGAGDFFDDDGRLAAMEATRKYQRELGAALSTRQALEKSGAIPVIPSEPKPGEKKGLLSRWFGK